MANYVICAACGARMRADRRWCLKCDEPLIGAVNWSDPAVQRDRRVVAATVVSVFLFVALILVWDWRTSRPLDETAHPDQSAAATASRKAAGEGPAGPAASQEFIPVTALDYTRVGAVSFAGGDFDTARVRYEQAALQQPDDPETLNNLGQVLVRLHRTDEAIERFSRATQLSPDKWAYHFNLAHALSDRGRWDAAIAEYRNAARLFPTDYATQFNLAMALHKKGDETAAVPEFEKAIALAPGEASFHLSLGISLEKLGRTAEAQREYGRYLEMEPEGADVARVKAHIEELSKSAPAPAAASSGT